MTIILHPQVPSAAVDLSELTFDNAPNTLTIGGSATINGENYLVAETFTKAPGLIIYLTEDGRLTIDATEAFAHVAWVNGEEVHCIHHDEPPEGGRPLSMDALADLLAPAADAE